MTTRDGYALDLLSPVRHVATEMERAGSDGPALTVEAMTATYEHTITGDLARIRQHENLPGDYQARLWLVRRAVTELGRQVVADGDGYRLSKPFEKLEYKRRKVQRTVRAGEEDEKEILLSTYRNLAHELRPFHVAVAGRGGAVQEKQLTLHPLAHAIPRMTEKEFFDLAADVKENGKIFKPILMMGGKVIDGRHRLAVAAALKVPVRVEEFTGDESEARHRIVSENLVRRHLTIAQRGLIVRQVLLPEAQAEVSPGRPRTDTEKLPPTGGNIPSGKTAAQIAADRSSGLASARTVERMEPVDDAPKTQERIRRGEITSALEARREALKETGRSESEDVGVLRPKTAWARLGCARGDVRSACDSLEQGLRDNVSAADIATRINEIREDLDRAEKLNNSLEGADDES